MRYFPIEKCTECLRHKPIGVDNPSKPVCLRLHITIWPCDLKEDPNFPKFCPLFDFKGVCNIESNLNLTKEFLSYKMRT